MGAKCCYVQKHGWDCTGRTKCRVAMGKSDPFTFMGDVAYTPPTLCTKAGGRHIDYQQLCIIPGTVVDEQNCHGLLGSWVQGQCMLAATLMPSICRIVGIRYDSNKNTCALNEAPTPLGKAIDTIIVTPSVQGVTSVQDTPSMQGRDTLEGFLTARGICEKVEHGIWNTDTKIFTLTTKDQTLAQCELQGGKMVNGHCVLDMDVIINWCRSNGHTWKPSTNTCLLIGTLSTPYVGPPTSLTAHQVTRSIFKELEKDGANIRQDEARDTVDKLVSISDDNSAGDTGSTIALISIFLTLSVVLILGLGYLRQMAINTQHGYRYVPVDRVVIDKGNHYIVRDVASP